MLAVWGGVLGLLFGAIMNIWFWPFLAGGRAAGRRGLAAGHERSGRRCATIRRSTWRHRCGGTSARAGGNALLLLFFGAPILRVLRRFRAASGLRSTPVTGRKPRITRIERKLDQLPNNDELLRILVSIDSLIRDNSWLRSSQCPRPRRLPRCPRLPDRALAQNCWKASTPIRRDGDQQPAGGLRIVQQHFLPVGQGTGVGRDRGL